MDTQQLARNQLDGILRAATFISGINYEQRIEELEKQNADLVAALEATQKLLDDIYAEDSIISSSDLGTVYEGNNQALAQVGE